jgi:putative nucleotidyltransferase with HDIG domain
MKIPTLDEAEKLLTEAEQRNPGSWVAHSRNVALAAKCIAEHSNLDVEVAYILGLLHDIGRQEGITNMRHTIDGYTFLKSLGYEDAARIALTHSFPYKHVDAIFGHWDCTPEERKMVKGFLESTTFDDYDRLLQLCDCLALSTGLCLLEKRMIDVALRHGVNEYTVLKWKAFVEIQKHFEQKMGQSIYKVLPGVVETTFLR